MCRSLAQGGRRCPCGRGERRRAYARARYAARNAEAARRARNDTDFAHRVEATEAGILTALGLDGGASDEPGAQPNPAIEARYDTRPQDMTTAEREQVATYAAGRARAAGGAVAASFADVLDRGMYSDSPARRAYEAALQEQGRHLSAVTDIELHAALEQIPDHEQVLAERLRMAADAGFTHSDGSAMTTMDVIRAIRSGDMDAEALDRFRALSSAQNDFDAQVRQQRERAHSAALRAALNRADPELSFGSVDLGGGEQPLRWGSGMTRAKQALFTEHVHDAFPDRLLEQARDCGRPLRVRMTTARAHYQSSGAYERVPAVHFVSTRDLLEAVDELSAADVGGENRASQLRMQMGRATRHVVPKGSVPQRYAAVDDTEQNRERLQTLIDNWPTESDDRYLVKRLGSAPTLVSVDGKLFLNSKKKVGTLDGRPVSELTTDGTARCSAHEMAHRIEENSPAISAACHAFLARRAAGLDQTVYNVSTRRGRRVVEKVTEDSFVDPYVGKDYGAGQPHTEVFSTGMEALAVGRFGGLTGKGADGLFRADPEHRQLVLAILASTPGLLPTRGDVE